MTYRPFEADLSGRVALVTGANSGMGKETARELARMGVAVILGCRSTVRGETARREIMETTGSGEVSVMPVDLSSLASVRTFARQFHQGCPTLDVLVNNAAASLPTRAGTSLIRTSAARPGESGSSAEFVDRPTQHDRHCVRRRLRGQLGIGRALWLLHRHVAPFRHRHWLGEVVGW